jgi:hypothetical protein
MNISLCSPPLAPSQVLVPAVKVAKAKWAQEAAERAAELAAAEAGPYGAALDALKRSPLMLDLGADAPGLEAISALADDEIVGAAVVLLREHGLMDAKAMVAADLSVRPPGRLRGRARLRLRMRRPRGLGRAQSRSGALCVASAWLPFPSGAADQSRFSFPLPRSWCPPSPWPRPSGPPRPPSAPPSWPPPRPAPTPRPWTRSSAAR